MFGYFIILTCPIIYTLCFSRERIFKTSISDLIIKKLTFILMAIDLILSQSAAYYFIGALIIIAFLIIKLLKSKFSLKIKYIFNALIAITGFLLIINFMSFNIINHLLNETPFNRVIKVILNIDDREGLYEAEGSFATRVILFYNAYCIFQKNPLFGVGYGNMTREMIYQLDESPIPLNWEVEYYLKASRESLTVGASSAIFFRSLAETGFIGTILLYLFFLTFIIKIDLTLKVYDGIEKDFLIGAKYFLIILILSSFYTSILHATYMWVLIGITHSLLLVNKSKNNNNNNIKAKNVRT
ncbi:MAG: O-antigen ligase family protein [Cyanobacteriota bacterium]